MLLKMETPINTHIRDPKVPLNINGLTDGPRELCSLQPVSICHIEEPDPKSNLLTVDLINKITGGDRFSVRYANLNGSQKFTQN